MKKSLFFLQLFIFSYFCQSQDEVGKISLSLVMPQALEKVDYTQLSKLETKINTLTSNYGIGASGYNNNFIIYPKLAIYDVSVVEGGMQNITVTTIDFSLFICQSDNNLIFSSVTKTLKGSGRDEYSALNNAIQLIPTKDKDFELFINTGKQKINKYYEENCDRILSTAISLSNSGQYEEAIGKLMQVPQELPCYEKIKEKSLEIYKLYANKICKSQLSEGDALIANQNYDQALDILFQIDPLSICFNEAQNRIKSIENKITEQKKEEREIEIKKYENQVELEKKRIEAIRDIAVAYYQRTQPTYNYNVIVK
jgi:hypothetical protein